MLSPSKRALCSLLSVAGTFGLVLASDPAAAASPEDAPRTARVTYADLNMGSAAGMATFQRRVSVAAAAVCAQPNTRLDGAEAACRARAADQARRDAGVASARD